MCSLIDIELFKLTLYSRGVLRLMLLAQAIEFDGGPSIRRHCNGLAGRSHPRHSPGRLWDESGWLQPNVTMQYTSRFSLAMLSRIAPLQSELTNACISLTLADVRRYMHVLPGMQGNNIWMVRQLSRLRKEQGKSAEAQALSDEAAKMVDETLRTMYEASADGAHGWWNVIWPVAAEKQKHKNERDGAPELEVHEMRHVVDYFSMAFGLCGVNGFSCDLNETQRVQLRYVEQTLYWERQMLL